MGLNYNLVLQCELQLWVLIYNYCVSGVGHGHVHHKAILETS